MRGILIVLVSFSAIAVCSANARWSEWRNATICNGRPCKCDVNKNDTCKHGHQVQVRICLRDGSTDGTCKFVANTGSIRKVECMNGPDTCPGWSKWAFPEECDCADIQNGVKISTRYCNNPPPMHPDVLCWNVVEEVPSRMEEDTSNTERCSCIDDTVTTTESPVPEPVTEEIILPCCIEEAAYDVANGTDDYDDYADVDVNQAGGGANSLLNGNQLADPTPASAVSDSNGKNDYYAYDTYEDVAVCRYDDGCPEKPVDASNSADDSKSDVFGGA